MEAEGKTPEQDPRDIPVRINPQELSDSAVSALVREFVLNEVSQDDDADPDQHQEDALEALRKGELEIWFTPSTEQVAVIRP